MCNDLLHETYLEMLKIKPETIIKFNNLNRLYNLGLITIRQLYIRRNNCARNGTKRAVVSPLFEIPSAGLIDDLVSTLDADVIEREFEMLQYSINATKAIEAALNDETESGKSASPFLMVTIFNEVNSSNISRVSKKAGVSPEYIQKIYEQGRKYLLKQITKQ